MPSLKEVKTRIESVKSTQQITSAMKMVAASKLRKSQTAILKLGPYANKLQEFLQNLSSSLDNVDDAVYSQEREVNKVLLIVVTSNRGLCGSFNANVIKRAISLVKGTYKESYENNNLDILCIGKKAADYFGRNNFNIVDDQSDLFNDLNYNNVVPLAEQIMLDYAEKEYDKVEIIYNQFKNAATQILQTEQYLPIVPAESEEKQMQVDFIFEPSKEEIVTELIPKSLKIQLYKAILDSFASEHGARMTAMHQATDNAQELLKDLRLKFNKARQASITNEILEIVSGAEALKN